LSIKELDIVIANIRTKESCFAVLPKKTIDAHALNKIHNNKRAKTERVVGGKTPSIDVRDGNE